MKTRSLDSLARLSRWELDERRRDIAELYRIRNELADAADTLQRMLTDERQHAEASGTHTEFAAFAGRIRDQQAAVDAQIVEFDKRIMEKQAEIATAFQELKRFEIIEERQIRAEREEADRREQAVLDEVGLNSHRRERR